MTAPGLTLEKSDQHLLQALLHFCQGKDEKGMTLAIGKCHEVGKSLSDASHMVRSLFSPQPQVVAVAIGTQTLVLFGSANLNKPAINNIATCVTCVEDIKKTGRLIYAERFTRIASDAFREYFRAARLPMNLSVIKDYGVIGFAVFSNRIGGNLQDTASSAQHELVASH